VLLLAGCAHTPDALQAREAERARRARCATVELYQFGITPPRRYRILGPVSVESDGIPAHSDRALQDRACEIGGDGVVDIREEAPPVGDPSLAQRPTVSGTAVAFVVEP
jgi:hypothetical protein